MVSPDEENMEMGCLDEEPKRGMAMIFVESRMSAAAQGQSRAPARAMD